MVRQTPADIDPDLWKDKGELTELPETPVGAVMLREPCLDPVNPKVMNTPDADVPMILDSPDEIERREGIHERIQAEIHQEVREEAFQEERLNAPLAWNEVEDLMMEDGEILEENTRPEKRRREEISRGQRKRRKKTTSMRRNKSIPLV